jgi:sirohydrochlorin cobaltochelatase
VADGVKELIVQPTHLMHGFEYTDIANELKDYEGKIAKMVLSEPLLNSDDDFDRVIKAITEATSEYDDGQTAICFMGHGTEAESNAVYAQMQEMITAAGHKNYFIATVEATPTFEDAINAAKAAGLTKAVLEPLMVVAGDHANNDMADEEDPESFASQFKAAGFEVTSLIRGLGQLEAIDMIYVDHVKAAQATL